MQSRGSRILWRMFTGVSSVLLALFLGACATSPTYAPEEAPEMIVVSDFAPFYSIGPQQMSGPDASLRLDTIVRLIRREFGFSYVQLEDGRFGYMSSQTIQVAPPRAPVASPTPGTSGSSGSSRSGERASESYSGPPVDDFVLPDLDLMPLEIPPPILLDDEESSVKPEFRL
jgi:hypothetical protein